MALSAGPEKQIGKLVVTNIGLLLSGALEAPILDADTIVAEGGRIVAIGKRADCDVGEARVTIDAHGCAVSPGLIDSHVHPVFGDWTPRQGQFGWIDSFLHGGVTTMVSVGFQGEPGAFSDEAAHVLVGQAQTSGTRLVLYAPADIPTAAVTQTTQIPAATDYGAHPSIVLPAGAGIPVGSPVWLFQTN